VAETANADKERRGRAEALALAKKAKRVLIVRGKKVIEFDLEHDPPHDDTLAAHLLGPTGNLRAPTARRGDTLYVGFNDEVWREFAKS
jgi:arsenate reductase-like glutaredoxin family protein